MNYLFIKYNTTVVLFAALIFCFSACQTEDLCESISCQNGGTCVVDINGNALCDCPDGFIGTNCETPFIPINPCDSLDCQNRGTCIIDSIGNAVCDCPDGFIGVNCEIPFIPINLCDTLNCQNGGTCVVDSNGNTSCNCPDGFTGINCSLIECIIVECPPNATCRDDGSGTCDCDVGFESGIDPVTGEEGCVSVTNGFLGDYIGMDICDITGESESYQCTITADTSDTVCLFINNLGGYNLPVKILIESASHFITPNQRFYDISTNLGIVDLIFEGTSLATLNTATGNIGISYRFTCVGCLDGSDIVDECDTGLIRQ